MPVRQLGDFTLHEELGRGGHAEVFRADHPEFGRDIAVKVFRAGVAAEPFVAAAKAVSEVDHPGLVRVYGTGTVEGRAFIAMRCLAAADLDTLLRTGQMAVTELAAIITQIATTLDVLHSRGVLHGDVKPANVLVTYGLSGDGPRAYLIDPVSVGGDSDIVLTVGYAAPERFVGEPGPAADQFSLTCVAFEGLTGRRPFRGPPPESGPDSLTRSPGTLRRLTQPETSAVDVIMSVGLAYRSTRRFASCEAMAAAFTRALGRSREDRHDDWYDDRADTWAYSAAGAPLAPPTAHPYPPAGPSTGYPPLPAGPPPSRDRSSTYRLPSGADSEELGRLRAAATVMAASSPAVGRNGDVVETSVFAEPEVIRGNGALIQVFAHLPADAATARSLALEFDADARRRGVRTLETLVERGEQLEFALTAPGLAVVSPIQTITWNGAPEAAQFHVSVPLDAPATVVVTVSVRLAGIPVGHIAFKISTVAEMSTATVSRLVGDEAQAYRRAFISYASDDYESVLQRLQVLHALNIEYFQDVALSPGERWAQRLFLEIDTCDVFLLFWSRHAKRSEWVRREVDYALARQELVGANRPAIRPLLVGGPPVEPPWEHLSALHFADPAFHLLYPRRVVTEDSRWTA